MRWSDYPKIMLEKQRRHFELAAGAPVFLVGQALGYWERLPCKRCGRGVLHRAFGGFANGEPILSFLPIPHARAVGVRCTSAPALGATHEDR